MRFSKLIPEVQIEIGFFRAVAISYSGSKRAKHRLIIIGSLDAVECLVLEEFFQPFGLLSSCQTKEDKVVFGDAKLSLKLYGYELVSHILDVTDACKRHLLLQIMTEPIAANCVSKDKRSRIVQ